MAIKRERLDKVVLHPDGSRWGQFEVTDLELFSIPSNQVKAEILKAADRLGLDWRKLQWHRPSDRYVQVIYGPMKHDVQQEDEEVAHYVSNRRHIDFSIIE